MDSMANQRFARIERLIGAAGLRKLEAARVAVIGLGAVGSYAVEGLARAGIGALRLIDFDKVGPSNINRQLYALDSTIGMPKVEVARRRVNDINPACAVEALPLFVHTDTLDQVLAGPPDVVIDAIDSVGPKLALIAGAVGRGIRLVSCMGAALRTDPHLVRVGPLAETRRCPLAKHIRRRLRKQGVPLDFLCVYSLEPVQESIEYEADEGEEYVLVRGRKRAPLGSLPTVTGIFGLTAANTVIQMLLGNPPAAAPDSAAETGH
jgi:tRNA threonylcarbamoyladenosine dehydratase